MPLSIAKLTRADDVASFDCGDPELNKYLHDDAFVNQTEHAVGVTYLARDSEIGPMILGYHTVATTNVPKEPIKQLFGANLPPFHVVPGVLLGRLAVHAEARMRGIGSALLRHALGRALSVKAGVGCRLMIVDAYVSAVGFYEQFGFIRLSEPKPGNRTVRLFIDLVTVEQAMDPAPSVAA